MTPRQGSLRAAAALAALVAAPGCLYDGDDRAVSDLTIGTASAEGAEIEVVDGLAHVVEVTAGSDGESGRITLWAAAPTFELRLAVDPDRGREWQVEVRNCMPDAVMTEIGGAEVAAAAHDIAELPPAAEDSPTVRRWQVTVPEPVALTGAVGAPATLRVAPADVDRIAADEPWRFAVMGDIQSAMDRVDDIFARINLDPTIRFVASTGDITEGGKGDEYDLWERQLATLAVPYYSTIGNHELFSPSQAWSDRYGRFNVHFRFRGAAFSLVDSGSSSIPPLVYDWLDAWLDDAAGDVHFFFTHYPPTDPIGVRAGSFRSLPEAHKLLARLAAGNVDVTFYGHIHSYYAYTNAGIPAYISGGGGAIPERWDGIGRHYLTVDVVGRRVENVAVVRVD
ncbi:metallophosphoesterase family protein [Haliangium sp.]|uniref:metallophosphoesterase family protein n=1 Tax=Haliangium sp. TaxID=2663208 RepID=UPI003D12F7FB